MVTQLCQSVSLVAQSCQTLCDPIDGSTPGCPVHHQLPEPTQTHVHGVSDAIRPCHPLSSPSPPAFNLSQHQGLFQWISSLHQVAKVLELQLQLKLRYKGYSNEYSGREIISAQGWWISKKSTLPHPQFRNPEALKTAGIFFFFFTFTVDTKGCKTSLDWHEVAGSMQ